MKKIKKEIEEPLPHLAGSCIYDPIAFSTPSPVEILTSHKAEVKRDEDGMWYVYHPKGTMDCGGPGTSEENAIVCGAMFVFLWYKGIECALAKQLAYFYTYGR